MPRCCGGATCACKISAGTGITVTGTGTAGDPFVVGASVALAVDDNARFDLTLTGAGTTVSPWHLAVDYAATSKLDDVPDVNAPAPTNGQVLGYDTATSKWTPRAPTTAASGSVLHGVALSGDGSAGSPLTIIADTARYIQTSASGVGITDTGINQMVRHFADDVARAAATPVPVVDSLSMLDNNPGRIDYWDGAQWAPILGRSDTTIVGGQFLSLSGPYTGAQRLTHYMKQIAAVTDSSGLFDLLDPTDLTGRGGVVLIQFQETGAPGSAPSWAAILYPNTDRVTAVAYRLSDGSLYAGVPVTGMVDAWLY